MSLAIRDVVGIHKDGFDFRFAAKDGNHDGSGFPLSKAVRVIQRTWNRRGRVTAANRDGPIQTYYSLCSPAATVRLSKPR